MGNHWKSLVLILTSVVGCVDSVPLTSIKYDQALVIEGYISSDFKQQVIRISRTSPLNVQQFLPESGATVTVHDDQGSVFQTIESQSGIYLTLPFAGIVGRSYQLRITTKEGKSYTSEEIKLKDVPEIGSIYATYPSPEPYASDGIQIYLDSPDPSRLTTYYRWEYEYTYEIQTPYPSRFIWLGGNNVNIRELPVDRCWHSDTSRVTLIQDNSHLEQPGVKAFPLKFIPADGRDLVVKYSILVRQYPLDEPMYRYWNQLKKINESQGTLFDIQPGIVKGNVYAIGNSGETVLGYFDAGVIKTKRVFFVPHDFAAARFQPIDYFGVCGSINPAFIPFDKIGQYMTVNSLTQEIVAAGEDELGSFYIVWPKTCCDCTRDGSNMIPDFWQ